MVVLHNAKAYSCWDQADRYDEWYDSPEGHAIFQCELTCVRMLLDHARRASLEVGVGTGRFAAALGVLDGIDPSRNMLARALARGIRGTLGGGERLPYRRASFDVVLIIMAFCFLTNPSMALSECARVLCGNGLLVLGFVPADSVRGERYRAEGLAGHDVYSKARFYTVDEVRRLSASMGFREIKAVCALLSPPGTISKSELQPLAGVVKGAGFVAMSFEREADLLKASAERSSS